jgi:hypothetical protein
MKKLTKAEYIKLSNEWSELCKVNDFDYSKFTNKKVKRRFIMLKRADDVAYKKINKRKNELMRSLAPYINFIISKRKYTVTLDGDTPVINYTYDN